MFAQVANQCKSNCRFSLEYNWMLKQIRKQIWRENAEREITRFRFMVSGCTVVDRVNPSCNLLRQRSNWLSWPFVIQFLPNDVFTSQRAGRNNWQFNKSELAETWPAILSLATTLIDGSNDFMPGNYSYSHAHVVVIILSFCLPLASQIYAEIFQARLSYCTIAERGGRYQMNRNQR